MSDRETELAALAQRVDAVDTKVSHIEAVNAMNTAQVLTSLDSFRTAVNARFDRLEGKVDQLDTRLGGIETSMAQILSLLTQQIGRDAK